MEQLDKLKCVKILLSVAVVSRIITCQSATYDITEPFDLTLILKLKKGGAGYSYPGELAGEARGEPRELPARVDVGSDSESYFYGLYVQPCCRKWEASGWIQLDDEQAASTRPLLDSSYRNGGNPLAGVWALQQEEGFIQSPKLPSQFSDIRDDNITDLVCLKILAKVPEDGRISVIAENTDKSGAMEIGEIIGTSEYEWSLTKLEKVKKPILQGHVARLKLIGKQPKDSIRKTLIQWTTFCAKETELLDNYYNAAFLRKGSTQSHYSLLIPPGKLGTVESPACLNGGSLDLDLGLCQCAPGFAGAVCEISCGPNRYGVHCTGTCSPPNDDRQCYGQLMCSNRGCKCFSGLQGDKCDEPCPPGYYGSDCDLKCGVCADEEVCNRYSGRCENGCEDGQQPPFCQEECGLPADKSSDPMETKQYFWNVGIYERMKKSYTRVCSASLVRPRYLLTAAWCFFSEETLTVKPASRFVALFGTDRQYCFTDATFPPDIEYRDIITISVPPLYRGSKRLHSDDIALVQLERAIAIAPAIAPLCYEHVVSKTTELLDGDTGVVAGWNLLSKDCDSRRPWRGYDVEYISHTTCLSQISDLVLSFTDTEKFCAKVLDDDSENFINAADAGDIGSGFVSSKYDVWYINGVKSGALANVNDSSIAIYTKVSSYLEWITSTWNRLDIKQGVRENV